MIFPKLQLTTAGLALLTKVVADSEELHFTKLGLGSGSTAGTSAMTNLVSSITITSLEKGTGAASMTGVLDNANLQTGYNATELGVYAQDPDDGEILYAYAFNGTNPTYIPAASSGSYERINLTVVVAIGDAEEVTATIGEFTGYASLEDFNAHVADTSNPHVVTAAQVGLGNVPNVSTDNQTPTFTEASTLENIASGETLKVILGKTKKAISALIDHITAKNGTFTLASGLTAQYTRANIRPIGHVVYVETYVTLSTTETTYSLNLGTITGVDVPSATRYFHCFVSGNPGLCAVVSSNNTMQLLVASVESGAQPINSAQIEFSYYVD